VAIRSSESGPFTRTRPLRVAVIDLRSGAWAAGGAYSRMLMLSLVAAARNDVVEVCAVTSDDAAVPEGVRSLRTLSDRGPTWARMARRVRAGAAYRVCRFSDDGNAPPAVWWAAIRRGVDVLLPVVGPPRWTCNVPTVGWIPDFQHVQLPEFFPPSERSARDTAFRAIADGCSRVILSSQDAARDFRAFTPEHAGKASVHPFPSLFAFDPPNGAGNDAVGKYHLPRKYALVINQLWAHKNHLVVIEALDLLRQRGRRLAVAMPGLPNDYRDPQGDNLSRILQEIAVRQLQDQVTLLGRVPFPDLVSLCRSCTVLIQPSRFEGWNTSIQDARALGRPVICSDLAVHREQVPDSLGFFGVDDPAALADLLERHWDMLPPGPDDRAEAAGLDRERQFAAEHGRRLLRLCRDVAEGRRPNPTDSGDQAGRQR